MMDIALREAPAVARNREPILAVLRGLLPQPAVVLEIASGTGEHALWFSSNLPDVTWQPTDRDDDALASIAAWRATSDVLNLLAPLPLDASAPESWPALRVDAVVAINMIHIAPWRAAEGLMAGAARVLAPGGLLFLYGPFREGAVIAPSNAAFDADLKARNPAWGVRDLALVTDLARANGFALVDRIGMPANNLSVAFRKS
jgi:SAM-dependent methyltransferase